MKDYNKTLWEDNITLVDARKLNNIEEQVDSITDKLSEVESNLNKNIDAIEQACTAITGEKFNSIDERIDSEIYRLNEKIEVSMLQQEDKESHTIENSVEGITTEMIIKGRTLQNVFTTSPNNLQLNDVSLEDNTFIVSPIKGRYPTFYDANGLYKENTYYTVILDILENTLQSELSDMNLLFGNALTESVLGSTLYRFNVSNGKKGRFIQNVKTIPDFSVLTRNLGIKMYMNNNYTGGKLKFNIMVIETSMLGTKQIPSYFSGIKSFGESEQEGDKYKISVLSNGKNLWDGTFTIGSLNTITGVETNAGENRKRSNFISIEKLNIDKITITQYDAIDPIYVHVYDENKNIIENVYTGNVNYYPINDKLSVTLPSNAKFLRFRTENNRDLKPTSIQIEEGTQSTSYQEYISNKKDILIKETLKSVSGFSDEMYEDNEKIKILRNIFIATLNGQEDIFVNNATPNQNNTMAFAIKNICKPSSPLICDKFSYVKTTSFDSRDIESITTGGTDMYSLMIRINRNKLETQNVAGFRKWLQANNIITYCVRNTPTTEIVENYENINLKTYNERTYVSFENTLSGISSFKAPIDTKETLSTLKKENENIKTILNSILESLNKK